MKYQDCQRMKNKEIKTVVPKLRFPEFQNTEGWKEEKIKNLCKIGNGKDYKHLNKGNIPVYGSGGYMTSVDDFLYDGESVCIGRKGTIDKPMFLTGKFWTVDTLFYTHSFHYCLPKFLYLIFQQIFWYKYNEAGGVPSLSKATIGEINISIPVDKNGKQKEQQKIADCLSSIDDLITSTAKKLEVLKAHKRGLIQQLFPAKGKKVPVIRFPEFQDAGEWKEKLLEQISSSIFDGTHQTPKYVERGIPFFSVENVVSGVKNKFISKEDYIIATSKNKPQKGDVLITRIGSIGKSVVVNWEYEFSVYVTLAVIKKSAQFNSYYLHSFFQTNLYQTEIQNKSLLNAVPCKINMEALRKTRVLLPPDMNEQQKIADCLSSLDDLITALTQKLEAFKTHKKGLMQQLFPDMTE